MVVVVGLSLSVLKDLSESKTPERGGGAQRYRFIPRNSFTFKHHGRITPCSVFAGCLEAS